MKNNPTSVFEFTDYRIFLREYLKHEVEIEKRSFRYLAKRAGLSSPNFLQRVLNGERKIKPASAGKIAAALGLDQSEKQYFCSLVAYEDARDGDLKHTVLNKLILLARRARSRFIIDESIHGSWLNYVLLELARIKIQKLTLDSAAHALKGLATKSEIAEQLAFLVKKSYLKNEDESYTHHDDSVTFHSFNDVRKIFDLQKCHLRYLDLAKLRISDSLSQREYQGLTVAIPWEHFEVLKKKMREFILEVNESTAEMENPNAVIRLQICAFQITKPIKEENDLDDDTLHVKGA